MTTSGIVASEGILSSMELTLYFQIFYDIVATMGSVSRYW